ncbi:toxin glutamine deamidase domain-containing protein [Parabacteroides distasonis]|uniref:toxin glutamine deamidase domain-containing protein n=1 Tax=Parabacteroides distasonis TaxID=823 RepID=UPI001896BADF|nr:toxin glutamine deamidase domain-containing protein [Parabacteroides distasonis]
MGKLSQAQYRRYFSTNDEAREAFIQRKTNGLNLSDRVWNYTNQFKEEIELGLDVCLRNGVSAEDMTKELRQYLKFPDKLFRRVRDEHGVLQLSKRAAAFHPGQGVYRSSFKNARRLAATETNIAYRTADYTRWQDLDFVVGIEIKLSNNHTLNGIEFTDICDKLKGLYPKTFKFTGWHPHCKCYAVTILKTEEEMAEDNRRIMAGEEPVQGSKNEVTDVPDNFKQWLTDNEDRAKRSFSVPYFITDNKQFLPENYSNLYAMKTPYSSFDEYKAAMKYNKVHAAFTPEQSANNRELSKLLPVIQGKIMNFTEADNGKANPNFTLPDAKDLGFHHNCQTCTMAYELRRRGFDIEAVANPTVKGFKNYRDFQQFCTVNRVDWRERFLTSAGEQANYIWSRSVIKDTIKEKLSFIEAQTVQQGRYEIYCAWKGKDNGAHVFIIERQKNGELLWFDPQSARRGGSFNDYLSKMKKNLIGVLRIDDKIINPKFSSRFTKP